MRSWRGGGLRAGREGSVGYELGGEVGGEGHREIGVPVRHLRRPCAVRRATSPTGGSTTMLWTILIVLAIIALALFILSQVRGRPRL